MPTIDLTTAIDDQGRLVLEHDFGEDNALREVRVTLELSPPTDQFRGSRLHVLNLVGRADFRNRIREIIDPGDVQVADEPQAVPVGHGMPREMTIEEYLKAHCPGEFQDAIRQLDGGRWWAPCGGTKPQMDLICKARIRGRPGILFVEAKAHEGELDWGGKSLADDASDGSRRNHDNIAAQITAASEGLGREVGPGFNLSIGSHYQLANRIAYLWKLASLGVLSVLLYLGFTGDEYSPDDHLEDDRHWTRVMGGYLQGVAPLSFPDRVQPLKSNGIPFGMLIRSLPIR